MPFADDGATTLTRHAVDAASKRHHDAIITRPFLKDASSFGRCGITGGGGTTFFLRRRARRLIMPRGVVLREDRSDWYESSSRAARRLPRRGGTLLSSSDARSAARKAARTHREHQAANRPKASPASESTCSKEAVASSPPDASRRDSARALKGGTSLFASTARIARNMPSGSSSKALITAFHDASGGHRSPRHMSVRAHAPTLLAASFGASSSAAMSSRSSAVRSIALSSARASVTPCNGRPFFLRIFLRPGGGAPIFICGSKGPSLRCSLSSLSTICARWRFWCFLAFRGGGAT